MEDDVIVSLMRQKDEEGIRGMMEKYRNYCYSICYSILRDKEDAEEVLNDTWRKVYEAAAEKSPASLKFYCGKVARNLALDRYEYETAQKRSNPTVDVSYEELENCLGGRDNPEDEYRYNLLRTYINDFLETIAPKDRQVFISRYYYFLENAEIASKCRMTVFGVKNRLSRVRAKLKEFLQEKGYFHEE